MSTKFLRATHKDGFTTSLHDSEFPLDLFREVTRAGYSPSAVSIDLLDYRGELLESNWNWRRAWVHVSLGELVDAGFTFPDPAA